MSRALSTAWAPSGASALCGPNSETEVQDIQVCDLISKK